MSCFTDQSGPKGEPHENEFWVFSNSEIISQTLRAEKVDEKNGILVFMFSSRVMVLKLSKKVNFLQFCADLSKKSKYIKAVYIYASERYCHAPSENDIVCYAMIYCFGDIKVWIQRTLLNFFWVSIFFDIVIANISWTVPQTPINNTSFWKSVMRTFRCIYEIAFTDLDFFWGNHKIPWNTPF